MPDITHDLLPNPRYHPLCPSIDDLLSWFEELDYEGNAITFEWADNEIKNHLLGYVRVGLVAHRVKLYKLYRHAQRKFQSFRDYCHKGLGKSLWYINCLIKASRVVLDLVQAGFTVLPSCEAQARPLTQFHGEELIQKWQAVLDSCPTHRLTAAHISQIVDPQPEKRQRKITVGANTYEQLAAKAARAGLSPQQLIDKLIGEFDPDGQEQPEAADEETAESPAQEEDDIAPVTAAELTHWLQDVQQLLVEHYGFPGDLAIDSS